MKIQYFISFLLISFMVVSCNKEMTDKDRYIKNLPGDYDWTSSNSTESSAGSGNPLYTYTPSILETNYGFRIKKNKKCFLFQDGKQIDSGDLLTIEDSMVYFDYGYYVYYKLTIDWGKRGNMIFYSGPDAGGLWSKTYPVAGLKNNFSAK